MNNSTAFVIRNCSKIKLWFTFDTEIVAFWAEVIHIVVTRYPAQILKRLYWFMRVRVPTDWITMITKIFCVLFIFGYLLLIGLYRLSTLSRRVCSSQCCYSIPIRISHYFAAVTPINNQIHGMKCPPWSDTTPCALCIDIIDLVQHPANGIRQFNVSAHCTVPHKHHKSITFYFITRGGVCARSKPFCFMCTLFGFCFCFYVLQSPNSCWLKLEMHCCWDCERNLINNVISVYCMPAIVEVYSIL